MLPGMRDLPAELQTRKPSSLSMLSLPQQTGYLCTQSAMLTVIVTEADSYFEAPGLTSRRSVSDNRSVSAARCPGKENTTPMRSFKVGLFVSKLHSCNSNGVAGGNTQQSREG